MTEETSASYQELKDLYLSRFIELTKDGLSTVQIIAVFDSFENEK